MYKAIKLNNKLKNINFLIYEIVQKIYESEQGRTKAIKQSDKYHLISEFKSYLKNHSAIDGQLIESTWFPKIDADIFISHSHKDYQYARNISHFLHKEYNIKCFIDSDIWGFADDLIQILLDNTKLVTEKTRSIYYSNVYLMLMNSLREMIDKTDLFLFLDSHNSIKKGNSDWQTLSPWIYSEIQTVKSLKRRTPSYYDTSVEKRFINLNENFSFTHTISDFQEFKSIDTTDFAKLLEIAKDNNIKGNAILSLIFNLIKY